MPDIEMLTLCKYAEQSSDGLANIIGAGIGNVFAPVNPTDDLPDALGPVQLGVALFLIVDWVDRSNSQTATVNLLDEDGKEVSGLRIESAPTDLPEGYPIGVPIRVVVTLSQMLTFPHPGRFVVRAEYSGTFREVSFSVRAA